MVKKALHRALFVLGLLFLMISCTEDELRVKPYPLVETLEIKNVRTTGATFEAKIDNMEDFKIIEHGFVWRQKVLQTIDENPRLGNSNQRISNEPILNNKFSEEIVSTLVNGLTYSVRAFVRTEDFLVYGKNQEFRSLGSSPPIFNDFSPKIGRLNDTIILKGKYFSTVSVQNRVFFKDTESQIIKNTDSTITCIVPDAGRSETVPIYIEVTNKRSISPENFSYEQPVINLIEPINGIFGDEVTISGERFSTRTNGNSVRFGSAFAQIISSDENTLKVIVPENIAFSSLEVEVISDSQEVTYSENFTIDPPEITFVSSSVSADNAITIRINNGHPTTSRNNFFIEDIPANVISRNGSDFLVRVPPGPFPRGRAKIKVQVLDQTMEYPTELIF